MVQQTGFNCFDKINYIIVFSWTSFFNSYGTSETSNRFPDIKISLSAAEYRYEIR